MFLILLLFYVEIECARWSGWTRLTGCCSRCRPDGDAAETPRHGTVDLSPLLTNATFSLKDRLVHSVVKRDPRFSWLLTAGRRMEARKALRGGSSGRWWRSPASAAGWCTPPSAAALTCASSTWRGSSLPWMLDVHMLVKSPHTANVIFVTLFWNQDCEY